MSMIRDLRAAVRPRPPLRKDSGSYDTTRDPGTPSAVVDCLGGAATAEVGETEDDVRVPGQWVELENP